MRTRRPPGRKTIAVLLACIGGGIGAGLLLGFEAVSFIPARRPASLPVPAAATPPPAAPASVEDALLADTVGHSLARSSGIATLAECEPLRAELRAGCRRYVRESGLPPAPANLLAP